MEVSSLNITGVYVRGSMIIWENIDLVVKPPCGTEKNSLTVVHENDLQYSMA